jgi:hypothetical protein
MEFGVGTINYSILFYLTEDGWLLEPKHVVEGNKKNTLIKSLSSVWLYIVHIYKLGLFLGER